jgi:hypothetical protein
VFENRVLRRIFGPKRDEVTGEWRKLHYKELHDLYSSVSVLSSIGETEKRTVGGGRQSCCFLVKNSLLKKDLFDGVLS